MSKPFIAMAGLMLALAGCQRFTTHISRNLGAGDVWRTNVDFPMYEQKVRVAVQSPHGPVRVYVVLDKFADEVEQALKLQQNPHEHQVLATKDKAADVVLEATIPKRSGFTVFVTGVDKPGDVKLTVTGF